LSAASARELGWQEPDYRAIIHRRVLRLRSLAENPDAQHALRVYYRTHIADFIEDWGVTFDTRNVGTGKPSLMPFIPWPKQREWIEFAYHNWVAKRDSVTVKSRDVGISWLSVAFAVALCVLYDGVDVGIGSQQQDKVDLGGDPSTLFGKARLFVRYLPWFFRGGCDLSKDAPYMRMLFRDTKSTIIGDIGDNIGRGARKSIFIVDEAAHLEHPKIVDASLSATTPCRMDVSSVNGMSNSFAEKYHSGNVPTFLFHWRDDPRKDDAWYADLQRRYDPVTIAQEFDCNFLASVEGIIIPPAWVQAAVDAHLKLPIKREGVKFAALDIADLGRDVNAFCARHGNVITHCVAWSGAEKDIRDTTERAYRLCDDWDLGGFYYDADGGGAHLRSHQAMIDERRAKTRMRKLRVQPFRASGSVFKPEAKAAGTSVKNKDRFQNLKAQAWDSLARRFQHTWYAVNGKPHDPELLISISSEMNELNQLCIELSQPQWKTMTTGKLVVDKVPDGSRSPDRADALMMLLHPCNGPLNVAEIVFDEEWMN